LIGIRVNLSALNLDFLFYLFGDIETGIYGFLAWIFHIVWISRLPHRLNTMMNLGAQKEIIGMIEFHMISKPLQGGHIKPATSACAAGYSGYEGGIKGKASITFGYNGPHLVGIDPKTGSGSCSAMPAF
jgi:hypothetical protein